MIREPGALYLVKSCGLAGRLSVEQANYLFNGGVLSDSATTENINKIATMQSLLPLVRLLGGSLRNQVIGGSLLVGRGILVCEENREKIQKMLPEDFALSELRLRAAEEFISQYQYTRGDAQKRNDAPMLTGGDQFAGDSNLMIYAGQTVIPGAFFYHNFILQNVSILEVGALIHALQEWEAMGGSIGGMARIGHGKMKMAYFLESKDGFWGAETDVSAAVKAYQEHCEKNKEHIVAWFMETFPKKELEKKKKPSSKGEQLAKSNQEELI
jgi:hypothetical protein